MSEQTALILAIGYVLGNLFRRTISFPYRTNALLKKIEEYLDNKIKTSNREQ